MTQFLLITFLFFVITFTQVNSHVNCEKKVIGLQSFIFFYRKSQILGIVQEQQHYPAMHSGGVGRGRVHGCGCWCEWHAIGDMCHPTHQRWNFTCDVTRGLISIYFLFWYYCYYPRVSRMWVLSPKIICCKWFFMENKQFIGYVPCRSW